jgi:tRNA modification GTPase
VAVVILKGPADQLTSCLTTSPPFNWDQVPAGRLCLYRWIDGNDVLDEVLIHRYPVTRDDWAVEISTHGGPRIVQRLLMQLRKRGAEIVPAETLLDTLWPEVMGLEVEALALLPQARTRKLAAWLLSNARLLTGEIQRIHELNAAEQLEPAAHALRTLLDRGTPGLRALSTLRVVLIGEPNAGKSTLANALAGQERAIVSDMPGTTRDWTEHPMAIQGIPFTVVDTAGIRRTADTIEHLAIERAHAQWATADLVIRVIDASAAPTLAEIESVKSATAPAAAHPSPTTDLFLWNKCDRVMHPDQKSLQQKLKHGALQISAHTGNGLETLRSMIIEISGYRDWPGNDPELFTSRQTKLCGHALSEVLAGRSAEASPWLLNLMNFPPEDTLKTAYNPM